MMISPLSGSSAVTDFCNGGVCSARTGRCVGAPTASPTPFPTATPTESLLPSVAANDVCQGPVSSTATTLIDTTDLSQFLIVDHPVITQPCVWSGASDGLTQSSDAWGNTPGDNSLMGCMAMYQERTYIDFIAEMDVTHQDNDGWGFVSLWQCRNQYPSLDFFFFCDFFFL